VGGGAAVAATIALAAGRRELGGHLRGCGRARREAEIALDLAARHGRAVAEVVEPPAGREHAQRQPPRAGQAKRRAQRHRAGRRHVVDPRLAGAAPQRVLDGGGEVVRAQQLHRRVEPRGHPRGAAAQHAAEHVLAVGDGHRRRA
jgi:hypothetical protein